MLLFRTEHGSHLYGLAHAGSDYDYYEVYTSLGNRKRAKQTLQGVSDTVKMPLNTFVQLAANGVPQALEAMFSPSAIGVDYLAGLRAGFVADSVLSRQVYRRTVVNFALGDAKRRRHALRLALNYEQISRTGRFNPRLEDEQAQQVSAMMDHPGYLDYLVDIFPYATKGAYYEKGFVDPS